jgi:hypothetical protein
MYLAKSLVEIFPLLVEAGFSFPFLQHVATSYNQRVGELDFTICRLALFLDPRYKAAIDTATGMEALYREVSVC